MRINLPASRCDGSNDAFQMRTEGRRRLRDSFADVYFPKIVEFDGDIDANAGKSDQVIRGHNPEPPAGHHQPAASVDVDSVDVFRLSRPPARCRSPGLRRDG